MTTKTISSPPSSVGARAKSRERKGSKFVWQRWAILAAGLALIIGIGVLTQRFQVKQLARTNAQQADTAAAAGDFQKAELLYGQHLRVVPDDDDIKIKYADLLHTYSPSPIRQTEALEIYAGILKRFPGREDVRRKQMELKFAMGRFGDEGAIADLSILLSTPANQSDGDLLYKMGFCCEESRRETKARDYYREAIAHNAPKKIDAYLKLAALLRDPDRLNEPKAADQAIEEMVQSAPENYQVYLARGRYRRQFNLPDSRSDFEKALKLADNKPDIYLELAKIAESQGGSEAAKRVLETGLTKLPTAAELYISAGGPHSTRRPLGSGSCGPRERSKIGQREANPAPGSWPITWHRSATRASSGSGSTS